MMSRIVAVWLLPVYCIICGLEYNAVNSERCDWAYPLVSGARGIPDSAFSASSAANGHKPQRSRFNSTGDGGGTSSGAWAAGNNRAGEWLEVRFSKPTLICKVMTKGRQDANYAQWVTKYRLSTSQDCERFTAYTENGQVKTFAGNFDRHTIVTHMLKYPVKAKCVRQTVLAFHSYVSMRFELLGRIPCNSGFTSWHGSCYILVQERASWMVAQGFCKWQGAELITVESKAENGWLQQLLISHGIKESWINLNRFSSYNWETAPGKAASFFNWAAQQPKNHCCEKCAAVSADLQYKWTSEPCKDHHYFVCEA